MGACVLKSLPDQAHRQIGVGRRGGNLVGTTFGIDHTAFQSFSSSRFEPLHSVAAFFQLKGQRHSRSGSQIQGILLSRNCQHPRSASFGNTSQNQVLRRSHRREIKPVQKGCQEGELAAQLRIAASRLEALEFQNVELFVDDASQGWKGNPDKKYDVIAVTGSIPEYLPPLEQRLATGGRLFMVLGKAPAMHAVLVTRTEDDGFERTRLFETLLKPLTGADPAPDFRF